MKNRELLGISDQASISFECVLLAWYLHKLMSPSTSVDKFGNDIDIIIAILRQKHHLLMKTRELLEISDQASISFECVFT